MGLAAAIRVRPRADLGRVLETVERRLLPRRAVYLGYLSGISRALSRPAGERCSGAAEGEPLGASRRLPDARHGGRGSDASLCRSTRRPGQPLRPNQPLRGSSAASHRRRCLANMRRGGQVLESERLAKHSDGGGLHRQLAHVRAEGGAHGSEQMHVNQLLLLEGGAETAEAEPFEQRRQFARVAARRLGRTSLGRTGLGQTSLG
mmetsp:Transcript_22788/g.73495  ORF Transcript_22788/g.73495 Transcript_22788/m.73495 type:complete len:205 (-) Transcript_22788:406-1020(-)